MNLTPSNTGSAVLPAAEAGLDVDRYGTKGLAWIAGALSLGPRLDLQDRDCELDTGQLHTGAHSRLALTEALLVELNQRPGAIDSVTFRIEGPKAGANNLCVWSSGYGEGGLYRPPLLTLGYRHR